MAAVASTYNASQKQLIDTTLRKFQVMSIAVARLYFATPPDRNTWTYNSVGAITVAYDNESSYYLKMIDIQRNGEILWEFPISKQMKYKEECNFFHSFYTDSCAAGLSFADENEARGFLRCVIQYMNQSHIPRSSKTSLTSGPGAVPSAESNTDGKKHHHHHHNKDKTPGEKGKKKKHHRIDKNLISNPTDFRHTLHMGAENFECFTDEEKKVIEEAFSMLNYTKDQLDDSKIKLINDFFKKNKAQPSTVAPPSGGAAARAPPPPVPAARSRAPAPPTPLSRSSTRGAPPPVPLSRSSTRGAPPPPPSRGGDKGAAPPPPSRSAPPPPNRSAPPVPNRSAPAVPSREAAAPPPLPNRAAAPVSAAPPPPPAGGPPPPPPPPSGLAPPTPYRVEDPNQPPKPKPVAEVDTRGDLLASIRNAGISSLKPASQRQIKQIDPPPESKGSNDLASALAMALLQRKDDMNDEDTDESSSDDSGSSDSSEWSD